MDATYAAHVTFEAREGQRDALAKLLLEASAQLADMPECVTYVVTIHPDDPNAVSVFEMWSDAEAHKASLEREDVREAVQRGMAMIAAVRNRVELEPLS